MVAVCVRCGQRTSKPLYENFGGNLRLTQCVCLPTQQTHYYIVSKQYLLLHNTGQLPRISRQVH